MRKYTHLLFYSLLLCLLAACGEDDDYYYPSVKMEFLTAYSGPDGRLKSVLTDEGKEYEVVEDASNTRTEANAPLRIVSNYDVVKSASDKSVVRLYGVLNAIAVAPKPFSEEEARTDPAQLLSGWMGYGYLNLVFEIMVQSGKHKFHFIEDKVTAHDTNGHTTVELTLYHDAGNDVQAYSRRAYLSVPLQKYLTDGVKKVTVLFKWHTDSDKVKSETYEYIPLQQ